MSLPVQLYTMLAMIAMGSFFGAALDTYQRFLKRNSRKRIIVFLNDVLFWVVQGLIIFYILFQVNHGELRFYLLLALICGFSAYQALMKRIYLHLLEWIISFFRSVALFMYKLIQIMIFKPVKSLIFILISIVLFVLKVVMGLVKASAKVLLWLLKTILFPLALIGKGLSRVVPASIKKSAAVWSNGVSNYFILFKRKFSKYMTRLQKWMQKLK